LMAREISKGNNLIMKCRALGCGSDTVAVIETNCAALSKMYAALQKLMKVACAHSMDLPLKQAPPRVTPVFRIFLPAFQRKLPQPAWAPRAALVFGVASIGIFGCGPSLGRYSGC
jgi:hypothetical protein